MGNHDARPGTPFRARKSLQQAAAGLGVVVGLAGCEHTRTHDVTIVDGANTTHFTASSAFAEYVELSGVRDELRVTLANYPLSCDSWVTPKEGDVALLVTIVTPAESPPGPASYAWTGLAPHDEPVKEAYALPKALFGSRSRLFEPGGAVRLTATALELRGTVAGTLAFEYPGDGTRPATRIDGLFVARVCRSVTAPP